MCDGKELAHSKHRRKRSLEHSAEYAALEGGQRTDRTAAHNAHGVMFGWPAASLQRLRC